MLLATIFVARILGLAAGPQHVGITADPAIQRVEIVDNGKVVRTLTQPPWRTIVDFGPEIVPHELTAIGYDAQGKPIARDSQVLNLGRPLAEVGVLLTREGKDVTATIRWNHYGALEPESIVTSLDGKVVGRGVASKVPLGAISSEDVHVVRADVKFVDGVLARSEIAFGGSVFSEETPAELTSVAMRQRRHVRGPVSCITIGERSVMPTGVERGKASVFFVRDGRPTAKAVDFLARGGSLDARFAIADAEMLMVAPYSRTIANEDGAQTDIFRAEIFPGDGVRPVLRLGGPTIGEVRLADAVSAAAFYALRRGRRRAVVLVFGESKTEERSQNSAAVVRRYLSRVGVPLHVWSLTGPRPDLEEIWGPITDVSDWKALQKATAALRKDLESQRIAWLPARAVDAFRAKATPDCALIPLARE